MATQESVELRMRQGQHPSPPALDGRSVVITRPAGTASSMVQRVRRLGGVPVLLPGLSLRAEPNMREAMREALDDDIQIYISPAAVRFAADLMPLRTHALVLGVGQGTAQALRRHGLAPLAPTQRQDSEGLLELPCMQGLEGKRVALIGAPGGRGVLRETLVARGARLRELHVYHRTAPRLTTRHVAAVEALTADDVILLSSAEALDHLHTLLPSAAWGVMCQITAIVSSPRLAAAARAAGFHRIRVADSAFSDDLLRAAAADFTNT